MKEADSQKLIVIVEDDPDVARIIEQVLNDFSFRTVWCRSAGDLLRRLRTLQPDLCIIDLGLPDMDGIEAMQRVRGQSPCGILILTGGILMMAVAVLVIRYTSHHYPAGLPGAKAAKTPSDTEVD